MKRRPYKTIFPKSILSDDSISNDPILPDNSILKRKPILNEPVLKKGCKSQKNDGKQDQVVPIEYKPDVHPLVASYMRKDGANDVEIAEVIGIEVKELRQWCRIYPDFSQGMNTSRIACLESVLRSLMKSALGVETKDIERMYEMRTNPVTRKRERILVREKENIRTSLPNPLACFFYLQNRDTSRWSSTGGKDKGAQFTPEQVSVMMRTSSQAISDFTLGEGLAESNSM